MAIKTWIYAGPTGANWGTAANWSPAVVPLAADDVIFNNTYNGNCTISSNSTCKSLVMTGYTGTLSGTTFTLAINGADVSSQSLVFSTGMTLTYNGTITFAGTSVTGNIYTSGKIIQGNVTFSGSGSNWYTYDDFITLSTSTLTLTQGNLQPYYAFSVGLFVSTGSLVRSSTGNGQTFYVTGIGTIWNVTGTNCSLSNFVNYVFNDATSSAKTITQTLAVASIPQNAMYITGNGTGSYTLTGNFYYFSILNTGGANVSFGTSNFYYLLFTDLYPGPGVVNSNVNLNSGASTVTFNTDGGGLTLSTAMTITASPSITISHPGIGNNVFFTFNGKTLTGNITINQAGTPSFGLVANDTFYLSGILTLTAGYFYPQTTSFIGNVSTSGTAVRAFGNGYDLYLTGSGTLIIATTTTNLGWGIGSIYVWGGQVASRTLTFNTVVYPGNGYCELGGTGAGAITLAVATTGNPRVYVTNTGGATVSFTTGNMAELIFSGGTNVILNNAAANTLTIDGDLTFVSTMGTPVATPSFVFKGSGYALVYNSRITLAGKSLVTGTVTLNDTSWGPGSGTFTFVDSFSSNAAVTITSAGLVNINANFALTLVTNTFTLTTGTLTVNNGANVTCGGFNSSVANSRVLNMGSGTWTITGTGTIWNAGSGASLTLNPQQSRILINNTASPATATTFTGGGVVYYTLEHARGASTGSLTITGNNTFANFIDNTSTAAHTITFTSASTQSFYKFNVRGSSASARITLARSSTTNANLVKLGQGVVCNSDYLIVSTVTACTPSTGVWYAGANSTGAPAGGWIAGNALSSQSLLGAGGVG
jgi:hypothetical protein